MNRLLTDPNNQLGIGGLHLEEMDHFDQGYDQNQYDEFIGKWLKKRKQRRANRRKARSESIPPNFPPNFNQLVRPRNPDLPKSKPPIQSQPLIKIARDPLAPKGSIQNPINNKDLKSHQVINGAVQNELKTMQEELKTEGLQKKVEQEDLKKENLKQKAGLLGAGKGIIVVAGILGTITLLAYLSKNKSVAAGSTA